MPSRCMLRRVRVRHASTVAPPPAAAPPIPPVLPARQARRSKAGSRLWMGAGVVAGAGLLYYAEDSRAALHKWPIPLMHAFLEAEAAHEWAVKLLPFARIRDKGKDAECLRFEWKGLQFDNPVGLSAGFDKHGEAVDALFGLGFGYVEIGSVTPEPQDGNPKPRVFRLPNSRSIINRYGFNSVGHEIVASRLRRRIDAFVKSHAYLLPPTLFPLLPPGSDIASDPPSADTQTALKTLALPQSLHKGKVLAINLGKNKISAPESVQDYVRGVQEFGPLADVLVVNVSSPNTPGLRSLQSKDNLSTLLRSVKQARDKLARRPPLLVKIAPDLSEHELADVAEVTTASQIDGIIVSNTTIQRPASAGTDPYVAETGGLSGPPLKPLALSTLASLYRLTRGKQTLIGCGGVSTAQDVLDYGKAGATFVQLYTALAYEGPGLPRRIKDDLADLLTKENKSWSQIVGSATALPTQRQLEEEARSRKERLQKDARVQFEQGLLDLRKEVEKALSHGEDTVGAVKESVTEAAASPTSARPHLIQESGPAVAVAAQGVTKHAIVSAGSTPQSGVVDFSKTTTESQSSSSPIKNSPATTSKKGGLFSTWGSRANADQYNKRVV